MQDKRNTEKVVQEIMEFIDGYAASGSMILRRHIASKLREMVENSLSVQEPLSYNVAKQLIDSCKDDGPMFLLRNVELAHGITQENQG